MWETLFLGIALGIIFCELCETISKKANKKLKEVENDLLLEEINKLKEQVEKQK